LIVAAFGVVRSDRLLMTGRCRLLLVVSEGLEGLLCFFLVGVVSFERVDLLSEHDVFTPFLSLLVVSHGLLFVDLVEIETSLALVDQVICRVKSVAVGFEIDKVPQVHIKRRHVHLLELLYDNLRPLVRKSSVVVHQELNLSFTLVQDVSLPHEAHDYVVLEEASQEFFGSMLLQRVENAVVALYLLQEFEEDRLRSLFKH